jgi:nitroreductase
VRAVLVTATPEEVFRGFIGSYGKIKGPPAFVAFIGRHDDPHMQEKVGFLGEGVILEATALGLGTCWVGGFFRPEAAASLAGAYADEQVPAVTPIGYVGEEWSLEEKAMAGFGMSHRRKPLSELVGGLAEEDWPEWVRPALDAARLAPSAVNRQPWRFRVGEGTITVSVDDLRDSYGISKRLDCGIAMLHIEVASRVHGMAGSWRFLDPPEVATWWVA